VISYNVTQFLATEKHVLDLMSTLRW